MNDDGCDDVSVLWVLLVMTLDTEVRPGRPGRATCVSEGQG
jgi:hypothetical protein